MNQYQLTSITDTGQIVINWYKFVCTLRKLLQDSKHTDNVLDFAENNIDISAGTFSTNYFAIFA